MSTFPIFHNLNSGAGFPGLSSYSAEQISLTPMEQPLYDHQKAVDLAALDAIPEHDLLAILGLQSSSVPCAHSFHVDSSITEESVSDVRNDFTAAIRIKAPHPRVAHACDYCRRRKTKCSGEQPVCTSCKKRGKVCQWTPLKTTKERRTRKPYDVGFEYNPRPRAPAPSAPYIAAPRATYPSVMLPNPMTIWSIEGAVSASQTSTISNAPTVKPTMQTPTGWSAPAQYDWQDVDIPSPLSSCPSLGSNVSSRESSPLDTPTPANSIPTSTSPLYFPVEEAAQNLDDIDVFFKNLYQGLSPDWSPVLKSWPDETEMLFAQ
ncbi:uncharacterized protein BJ212DRAFT_978017 [Suillus subaureus]|uniref:Zn(2)-C6 fungal-type domain-containing protein n=1 Tax=Suillus subaureus TaxID=48587 RepID=A0A9P7EHL6_9AGAM|nr:uncharacterized protein BJ212DRAFT_978017 [Suillus subaureus]KAG1821075.1 hypothetical protein BJ212DRAFT_978017 [Suillus subaureus]